MTPSDAKASATWTEIARQPAIWRDWAGQLDRIRAAFGDWRAACGPRPIWLSGAGTSAYIGDLVAAGLASADGALVSVPSTDLVARPHDFLVSPAPVVINFGRSGNSAESVGVLDVLDALLPEARWCAITCNGDSALGTRNPAAKGADTHRIILPRACHDSGFAMTSSFTTMLLTALAMLDDTLEGAASTRVHKIADSAEAAMAVRRETVAPELPPRIVFLGSGALAAAAREAALKVLELSAGKIPAISETPLGFRHGPKAFVTPGTWIVLFRTSDAYAARYEDDLAQELRDQFPDARVIVSGGRSDDPRFAFAPTGHDPWDAVLHLLPLQELAVLWAGALGLNADDPFEGQGTLTRVVDGVRLYDPAPLAKDATP